MFNIQHVAHCYLKRIIVEAHILYIASIICGLLVFALALLREPAKNQKALTAPAPSLMAVTSYGQRQNI